MKVVIVESPAKAKTINRYLGSDYTVLASYGHIRDLPSKDGSVLPEQNFSMLWDIEARGEKTISEIAKATRKASELLLATDPDREGEAISWHVYEVLKQRGALPQGPTQRIVFYEITKAAVQKAIASPRPINEHLVEAYLARRALDYLVGFNLSPVLWRKLPGSRSAGRVQSVALRLITDREDAIERFKSQEYWSVVAQVADGNTAGTFRTRLVALAGQKIEKMTLTSAQQAQAAVDVMLAQRSVQVIVLEKKQTQRHPLPPFTTSTLQQEAARKLGFSASRTMQIAQKLYEGIEMGGETVGLITYMRTDSVSVSQDAIAASRAAIEQDFGRPYLPDAPRAFKTKSKNAQEAHEAIRPTDVRRTPDDVARWLDEGQRKLYALIWKRMMASQMASAVLDQVAADIAPEDRRFVVRANGSTLKFDGFLKLYEEGRDDQDDDETQAQLPHLTEGQKLQIAEVVPTQHFTQPPPRYSEASLVKKLEELGIGRPSTYASIIQVLQDRDYVRLEKRQFHPEDRGRLVTAFLTNYFQRYVEYSFTADLEEQLDDIASGERAWQTVLQSFWQDFSQAVSQTKLLTITEVIEALNRDLAAHFFPVTEEGHDPRACPSCKKGTLSLKLGRFGAFIGCSDYPECNYTRRFATSGAASTDAEPTEFPKLLGIEPATALPVTVRIGPYGPYVQFGDGAKPKRVAIPKTHTASALTLDEALSLSALPRTLGVHPETGETVTAGLGRFGPFIKHGTRFISLKEDSVLTIDLPRAIELITADTNAGPRPVRARTAMKKPAKKSVQSASEKSPAKKAKTTADDGANAAKSPRKRAATSAKASSSRPTTKPKAQKQK